MAETLIPALDTEAWLYTVTPTRPTENKPARIRIVLEVEPTAKAAQLALFIGNMYDVVLTPKPPVPKKNGADPRQVTMWAGEKTMLTGDEEEEEPA